MSDTPPTSSASPEAEELPPYVIEGARSSRSRCKTCRRKIDKGALRIGILIEGPFGTGYLWHHLNCAAKRRADDVEEAYRLEAWNAAKEVPKRLPPLEKLMELRDKAEEQRKQRKQIPHVEPDPSGRAKCKQCGETIEKGSPRFVLGREVEFGGQVRVGPINVHPRCVAAAFEAPDNGTDPNGFAAAVRANSTDVDSALIEAALSESGQDG
jgi:hypothetical protein